MRRIAVDGNLPAAFNPAPVITSTKAFGGLQHTYGAPGTQSNPQPRPEQVWAPTPSNAPQVQVSNDNPPILRPQLYRPSMRNMGPQVWTGVDSTYQNPLPIPVTKITRVTKQRAGKSPIGRGVVIATPKVHQVWPLAGGGTTRAGNAGC